MIDHLGRKITYLRISVTDKCNLRCSFCMPPEGLPNIPHKEVLRYEEILRVTRAAQQMGIDSFRISGGEPLIKRGVVSFIKDLKAQPGAKKVSLTTNGFFLEKHAQDLADANLTSINVSLDSLNDSRFEKITGSRGVDTVLRGIRKMVDLGVRVKVNVLLFSDVLEELNEYISLASELSLPVRFIEYMPLDCEAKKRVSEKPATAKDLLDRLATFGKLTPTDAHKGSGPSEYYSIEGRSATIGVINAISNPFCSRCNRLRLTCDGFIKPCLASADELNVKSIIRAGLSEEEETKEICNLLKSAARCKPDVHGMNEGQTARRNMSRIGG